MSVPCVRLGERLVERTCLFACQGLLVAAGVPTPAKEDSDADMQVVPVPLNLVTAISTLRVSIPPDLRPADPRKATLLTVKASCSHSAEWKYVDGARLRSNQAMRHDWQKWTTNTNG